MSKNIIFYLLIVAVLVVFYIMFIGDIALMILILALIFPFLQFLSLLDSSKKIKVSLQPESATCFLDHESKICITIDNSSFFPVSSAMITVRITNSLTDESQELTAMFPVGARNQQSIKFSVTYNHCGRIKIELSEIKIYDYLRLFSKTKHPGHFKEVSVIPEYAALTSRICTLPVISPDNNQFSKIRPGDDCSEIFDIRDYSFGDKINRIHWNLSARNDTIMVKEYSLPESTRIQMLLDFPVSADSPDSYSKIDILLKTVMSLSVYMTENDIPHKIYWYNSFYERSVTSEISCTEDLYSFINELFSAGTYKDPFRAFTGYQSDTGEQNYSHTIYISSSFSDEILYNFSLFQNSVKKTYIYPDNCEISNESSTDKNISVIAVNEDNISHSLSDFEI